MNEIDDRKNDKIKLDGTEKTEHMSKHRQTDFTEQIQLSNIHVQCLKIT